MDTPPPQSPTPTFEHALAPLTWNAFLSDYWDNSFFHAPGQPEKFASLMPWSELNAVLEQQPLTPARLQMYQDGKRLDPSAYLIAQGDRFVLDGAGLATCLSTGATLVLNSVEQMAAAARTFADSLDVALESGTRTQVNLYAGWRTQKGFDLHWDDHHVTIVQVSGRKRWQVYAPTLAHPIRGTTPKPPPPTASPVWDDVLEPGEMLYLPRGWWHVAHPLDEPSLHLTLGTRPARTGAFLDWLSQQFAETRADVPLWAEPEDQQRYLDRVRDVLTAGLTGDVMSRFLAVREAELRPRPRVDLPHLPSTSVSMTMATPIRLARVRRLGMDVPVPGRMVTFRTEASHWECPPDVALALASLRDTPRALGELCGMVHTPHAVTQLKKLLAALTMQGIVAIGEVADRR